MSIFGNCDNFLIPGKCNKWIIDKFETKEFLGKIDYPTDANYKTADQICTKCPNFESSLTTVIINTRSRSTRATSTSLPPEVMDQEEDIRDKSATKMLLEKDENLNLLKKDELTGMIRGLLEGEKGSSNAQKGDFYIYIGCNIHESQIGGTGHTMNVKFHNIWNQLQNSMDESKLKNELETLIEQLKKVATRPEHFKDLSEVITANEELKKNNGPGMLKYLKKAGNWVLNAADKYKLSLIIQIYQILNKPPFSG